MFRGAQTFCICTDDKAVALNAFQMMHTNVNIVCNGKS